MGASPGGWAGRYAATILVVTPRGATFSDAMWLQWLWQFHRGESFNRFQKCGSLTGKRLVAVRGFRRARIG